MGIDNTIVISGNLTRDLETRFTPSGTQVVHGGLAQNRRWKNAAGEQQESTNYFDFVIWGDVGAHATESLSKGDRVILSGRLEYRSWKADVDGQEQTRSKIELVVDDIGPSLRWATATVAKVAKGEGNGAGARVTVPPEAYDEEPF